MLRLRELRKEKGLTQKETAAAFKVAQATWSGWETEEHAIDTAALVRLAGFFDVSVDYLLGCSDDKRASNQEGIDKETLRSLLELGVIREDRTLDAEGVQVIKTLLAAYDALGKLRPDD